MEESERKPDYYHQKKNARIVPRVAERLKTEDLGKFEKFEKIPEMLGSDGKYPAHHPKAKLSRFLVKICKKSQVKHSIEEPILLNFMNLPTIFCPRS